jgi:hypothetical protein
MGKNYSVDLKIFGESGTLYRFTIREDLEVSNIKETVFLICKKLINEGITNEAVNQQPPAYLIKMIGYTENFWKYLIDNHLIDSGVIVAYFWDVLPYGKTYIDLKNDILKNTTSYPGITEILTTRHP